jgi:DUF971 family protein
MSETPRPTALRGEGDALVIQWSDGATHRLPWALLRKQCPCATCRAKRAEPPPLFAVLKPEEAQPIKAIGMQPLGNYAYHIDFNDGHNTGIFTLEFLRTLGEEAAKGPA